MKQRIFSLFTAFCLCLSLLPTAAFAEGEDSTAPQGDTDSTNYYEIDTINETGDGGDESNLEEGNPEEGNNNSGIEADGSVSYRRYNDHYGKWEDKSKGNGEYIVITDTNSDWDQQWYVVSGEVTINNDVTFSATEVNLILCDGAELTINGQLKVDALNIYGQTDSNGKLTVINNNFDSKGQSYGMVIWGDLIIHGGYISAAGGSTKQDNVSKAHSYGIYVDDSLKIYGGTVEAEGGDVTADNAMSIGIDVRNILTVSNCSLTATAGETNSTGDSAHSRGLWVSNVMTVTNSAVTAVGGNANSKRDSAYSYGLDAMRNITVNSGSLNATADKATGSSSSGSYGIYASGGLTVSGGKVKLPAGSYIEKELKVEGNVTLADLLPVDGKKYGFKDWSKGWHESTSTEKTLPGAIVKLWPIESVSIDGAKSSYTYGEEIVLTAKVTQQSGVTGTPAYEWFSMADGNTEMKLDGETTSTLKPGSLNAGTSYTYRVKATVDDCSVTSEPVTFSVNKATLATEQYSAPTANTLTYNNGEQELVSAGTAPNGCTMQYKLGNGEWSSDIPKAKNAGNYTVYWQILGGTNYEDVTNTTPVQVSIAQKTLKPTVSLATSTFDYDGTAKTPAATVMDGGATISASEYRVSYSNNINAGTATVTVTNQTGGNYVIETATADFTINKATYNGDKTASGSAKYGNSNTVDLSGLIMPGGKAKIGTVSDSNGVLNTYAIEDDTSLEFSFKDTATVSATATITVNVSDCTNYTDYTLTVTLTVNDKLTPTVTAPTAKTLTYNGSEQTLINAATTTGGTLQYKLGESGTWSAELPKAKNADTYTVYYKVEGDTDYADTAANSISVTIGRKAVTVKPKSYTITKGNAIPTFALEYVGLVSGDTLTTSATPDFTCYEADGNTAVSTSTTAGSYTITWTNPDDFNFSGETNYTVSKETTGTLTINNKPSSSGGGGSSSNTTSTTVKNPDGSTTTTVTDKKTGTVTVTTTTVGGTTSTTVTDKNGNSTTTVSVSKKDAQSGETITLPVDEVRAAGSSKDAQEITVNVPSGGATVEIPVKNPTPGTVIVIVDKDGNEVVVPTTKQTENGVTVTLTEDATIKVIENSKDFSDVKSSDYFDKAVDWASSRGITGGNSATTFGPHDSCTRAQLVTFLWRAAGQPEAANESDMSDVATNTYYTDAVAWAFENGIVGGYGNGLFGSDDTITREQMAVILYRFAQHTGMDTTQGGMSVREYKDYDNISDYAMTAMQWAVNAGVMQGYDGNLMPGQPCTRAQIVTMLYRLLGA